MSDKNLIKIKYARCIYPSLFRTEVFKGEDTQKYSITLILDKEKDAAVIEEIQAEIDRRVKDLKVKKLGADKICLKDGDESGIAEYEGCYTIKATRKKKPKVFDSEGDETDDEDLIYGGCFVNAIIDLWTQNNSWGKRVNANIYGVKFVDDGEPLGGLTVTAEDFEDLM